MGKNRKFVWVLLLGHIFFISIGSFLKIVKHPATDFLLVPGIICFLASWFIIFFDITKKSPYNKTFWLLSMFILPTISPVVYWIRRKHLIRFSQMEEVKIQLFDN